LCEVSSLGCADGRSIIGGKASAVCPRHMRACHSSLPLRSQVPRLRNVPVVTKLSENETVQTVVNQLDAFV
jgi:hypothetical protein